MVCLCLFDDDDDDDDDELGVPLLWMEEILHQLDTIEIIMG